MRFLLVLCILLTACRDGASAGQARTTPPPVSPAAASTISATPTTKPAAPSAGAMAPAAKPAPAGGWEARFSGGKAWAHLHQQVAYGPRVPGTPSHKACQRYLEKQLLALCDTAEKQDFSVTVSGQKLEMANLIGRFKPQEKRRILLAAHWDSRPTADYNPQGRRGQAIDGANDGASGVAVLLELARVLKEKAPPVGVDIVFFDGEDYGPGLDMMLLGSKYFAKRLTQSQVNMYNFGILLDMIGDRNLSIPPEANSEAVAGLVFSAALECQQKLGHDAFTPKGTLEIIDDHTPLIERGLRVYDFIDFDYPYWHTTEDTEDKCSIDSLNQVGQVLEMLVYQHADLYAP